MRSIALLVLLALSLLPAPAHAEWLQASSAHFVVYANDNERNLRRFSDQLERYHAAMALLTGQTASAPSPSNRVTVYVVQSESAVRKLAGSDSRYVAGFYVPRAGGSVAIVPQVSSGTRELSWSMIVLLHEYAHHFSISANTMPLPRWVSEGGAEFFASSSFEPDGGMWVGRPAQHRAAELVLVDNVQVADLLDPTEYLKRKNRNFTSFYGKSWALYHYLVFDKDRTGQLSKYLSLLAEGKDQRTAALEAFGSFEQLERDIDRYVTRQKIMAFKIPGTMLSIGPVAITRLSAGAAAIMPTQIRSRRGVDAETAKAVAVEARAVAARFPDDPAVLAALAETEFDAGNDQAAITAADAALKLDPSQTNAYIQKGYALFRLAEAAEDKPTAYRRARAAFIALNRREPDHPIPLVYFYRSFVEQGLAPTPLAVDGLTRAAQLAPFDLDLRMMLGTTLIRLGRQDEARSVLQGVANNPHRGGLSEAASRMLARLESQPKWTGEGMDAMMPSGPDKDSSE